MKVKSMLEFRHDNTEVLLTKCLLKKTFYTLTADVLDIKVFSEEFRYVYACIKRAHESTTEDITTELVLSFLDLQSTTTTARRNFFEMFLDRVNSIESVGDDAALSILTQVQDRSMARQIADIATQALLGKGDLTEITDLLNKKSTPKTEVTPVDKSIDSAMQYLLTGGEFKFGNGLEFIGTALGDLALARGQLMIIFALSNAGKSSFVAQYSVGLLQQGLKVLYFGNEDCLSKILVNFYRSYYGMGDAELHSELATPKEFDNLTLIEAHGMHASKIEKLVEEYKPDAIIFDQIDNVGFKMYAEDVQLSIEKLYQWTRSLAALHKCLVVNVTQSSNDANKQNGGESRMELTQHMMANSKIGKASTADLILGIGLKGQADEMRCITACKNKINSNHSSIYCRLNTKTCRYEE